MNRRNFFATLIAPLVAKWWPKAAAAPTAPVSLLETINDGINPDWNGTVTIYETWTRSGAYTVTTSAGDILREGQFPSEQCPYVWYKS